MTILLSVMAGVLATVAIAITCVAFRAVFHLGPDDVP